MVDTWNPIVPTGSWSPISPPSSEDWVAASSTGVWDDLPPSALPLLTESGLRLRTESDVVLLGDLVPDQWPLETNGAATWTVI